MPNMPASQQEGISMSDISPAGRLQGLRDCAKSRWLRAMVAAFVVLVLLALLAPRLLNTGRFSGLVSNLFTVQTGRQVTLGSVRATFLPRLGFTIEDFRMDNPGDFAPGEFIVAREIRGRLAFWPLVLRRELRITSLDLVQPKIVLLQDESGRVNYAFSPVASLAARHPGLILAQADVAPGDGGSGPRRELSLLRMDEVTLRDAEILFGSLDRGGRITATVMAAGISADLRYLMLEPLQMREWQMDAQLGGVRLTLAGWKGPITIDDGYARLRDGGLDSDFTLDLGNAARMEGTLTVADIEHAVPAFDLRTQDLDFDALIAGLQTASPSARTASHRFLRVSADEDAAGGASVLAEGHLAAERIRAAPYVTGPATADIRLYADRIEIWPLTLRFGVGSFQVSARTDRRQMPQRFSVNLQARNIRVAQIVDVVPSLQSKFAGMGEFDVQFFGTLGAAWLESLQGRGQVAIRNGRIRGFDLAGAAQSLADLAGLGGDMPFTAITADLEIGGGRVRSRHIHLNSPRGTVDMRGTIGFEGALRYDGQFSLQIGALQPSENEGSDNFLTGLLGNLLGRNRKIVLPFSLRGTLEQLELLPGSGILNFPAPGQSNQSSQSSQSNPLNPAGEPLPFPNLFGEQ